MPKEHVYKVVKNAILEVLPHERSELISIKKNLKGLGANLIDRLEVVMMSMEKLGLNIPLIGFAEVNNIESLVDVLTENYVQDINI
jgi:polyketide biosynthesis acyl carrier protein